MHVKNRACAQETLVLSIFERISSYIVTLVQIVTEMTSLKLENRIETEYEPCQKGPKSVTQA